MNEVKQRSVKLWSFIKDEEKETTNETPLASLWEAVVSPAERYAASLGEEFTNDDLQQALAMLKEIESPAPTDVGSYQLTSQAKTLKRVVANFKTHVAKAGGRDFEEIRRQAEDWYDEVERVLLGLVNRFQRDTDPDSGFIGGDPAMKMRRTIGLGGLMAITSPSVPVKQNVLMTIIGAVVSENALAEVYREYKEKSNRPDLTFRQFVEELVLPQNYTTFRDFLNRVEKYIFGEKVEKTIFGEKNVTSYKVSGKEYKIGAEPQGGETEPILTPKVTPKAETEAKAAETIRVQLKLGNEVHEVVTPKMFSSNLLKGILLYVDALATPEFSDDAPVTKWTWDEFQTFYTQTNEAIKKANLSPEAKAQMKELGKRFLEREKSIRYGAKPTPETQGVPTAAVGERTTFGNALRDYYVMHFGSEATKVKSFGISLLFNTLAEKLGVGSSLLPSVVYDVWMNANVHNLLREAERGHNATGLPTTERVAALQQKYREALLPYGFDVEIKYDSNNNRAEVVVKDYKTGNAYRRKYTAEGRKHRVEATALEGDDDAIVKAIQSAPDDSAWGRIRKAWEERRMFLASEQTESMFSTTESQPTPKIRRLGNLTQVFLVRREKEEWHSVASLGKESAAQLVLKELEKAVEHFMTVAYDPKTGDVVLLKSNPAYQAIMNLVGKDEALKQKLLNERGEMPIQYIANAGRTELWEKYKEHINKLREGGVPSVFSEHIMKNALYSDKQKPLKIRALQALLWVCTRRAL